MNPQTPPLYRAPAPLPLDQDPQHRRKERIRLGRIGLVLLVYQLFISLVQLAALFLVTRFFPQVYSSALFQLLLRILPAYLLGVPLVWGLLSGMPKKAPKRGKLGAVGWISFFAVSYYGISAGSYIGNSLMAMIEFFRGAEITNAVSDTISSSPPLFTLLLMVIVAPIAEELLYRKLLIDRLLPYSEKFAVLVSAILFGLLHGNFYQFFYAVLVGLIFGYVYVKTGNILHTILMHMLLNFTGSIISNFLSNHITEVTASASSINIWNVVAGVYSLAMTLLSICGMILFFIKISRPNLSSKGERGLSFKSQNALFWSSAGILSLLIFSALTFVSNLFI